MKSKPSKLDAHAERLDEWFGIEPTKTLDEAREQLRLDGLLVSRSQLSRWWQSRQDAQRQASLLAGIVTGSRQVKEVDAALAKNPAPEMDTLIKLNRVIILQLNTKGQADPELLKLADQLTRTSMEFISGQAKARLETQKLAIQERRVKLLETKARQADEAGAVVNSQLSPEEKQRRLKSIFGM